MEIMEREMHHQAIGHIHSRLVANGMVYTSGQVPWMSMVGFC